MSCMWFNFKNEIYLKIHIVKEHEEPLLYHTWFVWLPFLFAALQTLCRLEHYLEIESPCLPASKKDGSNLVFTKTNDLTSEMPL